MTLPPNLTLRHDSQEISSRVNALATRLNSRVKGQELLVVGVLKGSALFLADLVRGLSVPVRFEFIDVARHDEADPAGEPKIAIRFFRHFSVKGCHVLLLKDVVNTGVVETYLLSQLRFQGPKSLALACIIDRLPARRVQLEVDEPLFQEPEDRRWVGYGLESADGLWGGLSSLATVEED